MTIGTFIWADLSTFRLAETQRFYARLFGWTYTRMRQPDGSPYEIALTDGAEDAALFEMPEAFQTMGLPSFWMPYFAVADVERACHKARSTGGKVEMGPLAWSSGRIALIRDPLGAGFTVYEGNDLSFPSGRSTRVRRTGCALYLSDAKAVEDFYQAVFDWRIMDDTSRKGGSVIHGVDGKTVAGLQELSEDVRGPYQYWGIHFAVSDPDSAARKIEAYGGKILSRDHGPRGLVVLAADPDGAAFYLRQGFGPGEGAPVPGSR